MPDKVVAVDPAPGAVLTAGPRAVAVRFPAAPTPPVQLQVLDTQGDERAAGPVGVHGTVAQVAVATAASGTYTILWSSGRAQGSSTFTVWRGGPLPPSLARAAYGGATAARPGFWLDLWTAVALAGALFFLGGTAATGAAPRRGTARRGALFVIAGALLAALERVALAAGVGLPRLVRSPLFPALMGRGVALDGLLAAALALLALAVLARRRPLAIGAAALTLALLLATLPPLRTGALLPAWAAAAGLALTAGALPGLSRRRSQEGGAGIRWIGAALAVGGGVVLGLRAAAAGLALGTDPIPLAAGLGTLAALVALACGVLPRPPRGAAAGGALCLVVAAAAFSPVLTRPAAGARGALTLPSGTPGVSARSGRVTLRLSSALAGVETVEVLDGGAAARLLPLTISLVGGPRVSGRATAVRVAAGVYAASTTAFSVPGTWRVTVAGQALTVHVGGSSLGACRSFAGAANRWAALGGPVLALATAPGAPDTALAATARGVFATADGGRTWTLAGDPGRTTALAVDRYGQWWAATTAGLRTSQDGGVSWLPVPGLNGAAGAVFTPVYPSGVPLWAVVRGSLFERTWQTTFTGLQTTWGLTATVPGGAAFFTAVPPAVPRTGSAGSARWQGQPVSLLAGGPGGLWQSTSGRAAWARVLAAPVRDVAVGVGALWAVGPDGLYTAAHAAGPWRAVPGLGGGTAVTVGGPSGGTLFAARPGAGLLRSTDGGRTWTSAGCPVGTVTLLAGTYVRGRPAPLSPEPAVYLADARGDVAAVLPES